MLRFSLGHRDDVQEIPTLRVKRQKKTKVIELKEKPEVSSKGVEELALEKLVFGDETDVLDNLEINYKEETENVEVTSNEAAWIDEDDEIFETKDCLRKKKLRERSKYSEHLREKFESTIGKPKWAEKRDANTSSDDSDEEIVRTTGNLIQKSKNLIAGTIDLGKCANLNHEDRNNKIINSVKFHPTSQVALVADVSGKATIFQVNGKSNNKIQSIQFQKFPIHSAEFTVDGEQIVVGSSQYSHFYYYDMMAGKIIHVPWEKGLGHCNKKKMYVSPDGELLVAAGHFGDIHLISAKTKEWIGQLKMNGEVVSITFSKNGKYMYSHGEAGRVHVWDLKSRQCVHQFYDNGCITGTCIAVSPNDQYLATGSDSGIVNVYENPSKLTSSDPKPLKIFQNLTTEITSLKFNHSSELLAMASNLKDNAVKLGHFPSMTIYSNFPSLNQGMFKVTSVDISANSGYFAAANNKGTAHLFRIKTFGNY